MPIKYEERLKIPVGGLEDILFYTNSRLMLSKGYNSIVFTPKGPFLETDNLNLENTSVPNCQHWRIHNPVSSYIEHRSKDYCSVRIIEQKFTDGRFRKGMFYISPFDLISDKIPVLITPLKRERYKSLVSST